MPNSSSQHSRRRSGWAAALAAIAIASSPPARAEGDLVGDWGNSLGPGFGGFHEDNYERIEGPYPADYGGFPLSDAGRMRADAYDASLLTVPEHQCMPHPNTYSLRGPGQLHISKVTDDASLRVIAFKIQGTFRRADRTIWMDGRPHPGPEALHTWAGFSTGSWNGYLLKVETTHLKQGWLSRNGVATSPRTTVTAYYLRHGNYMTVYEIISDPVYLSEPMLRSTDFVLNEHPNGQGQAFSRCFGTNEVGTALHYVPHYLPGKNSFLHEYAERFGLPFASTRGYAEALYPEYVPKLQALIAAEARQPPARK
jgi:hypothetical protein